MDELTDWCLAELSTKVDHMMPRQKLTYSKVL